MAVAVPREPVLYEFGGELIDRAARPEGVPLSPPWSSVGGGAIPAPVRPLIPPKAAKKERKGKKKDKKKKGKGLKKKGLSENSELSRPAAAAPTVQNPRVPLPDLEEANAILSDAPAWGELGRERAPAPPSPVPTASRKRRRKERYRKKRLKSKAEAEPAQEPGLRT